MVRKIILERLSTRTFHLFTISLLLCCIVTWANSAHGGWVRRYHTRSYFGWGTAAMAVDRSGNVYVACASFEASGKVFCSTIKYDTNGNRLWVSKFTSRESTVAAIAVDSNGNVYVAGFAGGGETGFDYMTIKYDMKGNFEWVRWYDGPAHALDKPTAMAVDNSGNVYLTGQSVGVGTQYDYATLKYDTNGNRKWVRRYSGGGRKANSFDVPSAMALDGKGNLYVTGSGWSGASDYDYLTIKYETKTGARKWIRWYNGPDNLEDLAVDRWVHLTPQSRFPNSLSQDFI